MQLDAFKASGGLSAGTAVIAEEVGSVLRGFEPAAQRDRIKSRWESLSGAFFFSDYS